MNILAQPIFVYDDFTIYCTHRHNKDWVDIHIKQPWNKERYKTFIHIAYCLLRARTKPVYIKLLTNGKNKLQDAALRLLKKRFPYRQVVRHPHGITVFGIYPEDIKRADNVTAHSSAA